ncbi:MAG TPA: iron dependent repressor, metal binding and dimerization domain protein [Pseudonocardia sp.]|jgi:DtxR family Mn-dependent transcriptional regulator|nr:iron dependent repressor, metal binding and dimerization domain protein [Pseudonocardia sp.]
MRDLVDTTEMFLRTIYELEEEGVPALRARIAERLAQSGPTVSQTIARMERDGLVLIDGRRLELTAAGQSRAVAVMRKHRLAECLLVDVIGLELEHVHAEACRWEHVMSEAVERKLLRLLNYPTVSPYGNPIPGLAQLEHAGDGIAGAYPTFEPGERRLDEFARHGGGTVEICRIGEHVQADMSLMAELQEAGVEVGEIVEVRAISSLGGDVPVKAGNGEATVPPLLAHAVLVRRPL